MNNSDSKLKTLEKYKGQYSESKLWSKISRFAKNAGMDCVYYVLLVVNMMTSKEISPGDKAVIIGALGYFICPLDLIPDLMIGTGYLDDAGMLILALNRISSSITPSIMSKSREKLHEYFDFKDEDFHPKFG